MAHAFLTVVANLKFPETYYLYTYYEFLFSSGLDLRYNDSVALLRLVFRAIFHPGLPAFTVLPDSSFFSFFFLFLSLSLSLPFSSSSLLNLRTSLKARWPRAKKRVLQKSNAAFSTPNRPMPMPRSIEALEIDRNLYVQVFSRVASALSNLSSS